jgi:tetratricopeptide (TPR) repeat protein
MKIFFFSFVMLLFLNNYKGFSQTNIIASLDSANPIRQGADISLEEKIKSHEAYLKKAVADNDIKKQFYGTLYLYDDHLDTQDYEAVAGYAIQAENIADKLENRSWLGLAKYKSGWVDFIVHEDMRSAIKKYEQGIELCTTAGDTLCVAECLAQIACMYTNLKAFDSAQRYFNTTIPILKKFPNSHLSSAYNNFVNLFAYQNRSAEALPYIDTAIRLARKKNNVRSETVYLTNRALLLHEIKQYNEALVLLKSCMAINKKNNWLDNLVYDYAGIAATYYDMGNYKEAYDYSEKYHALEDSLAGAAVKNKVFKLTAKNESQRKELALKQSQMELQATRQAVKNMTALIIVAVIVKALGVWIWKTQANAAKRKRVESQNNLSELTRMLLDKNTALSDLEKKLSELQESIIISTTTASEEKEKMASEASEAFDHSETEDFEKTLYNQRILTQADWSSFKIYFDKAYPGYLLKLRKAYPSLTEAEERLFLFIKLKLTRTEIAAMLGITADSVKKTRARLRKRLELSEDIVLDEFVKTF